MTINQNKQGDITVLEMKGRLDADSSPDADRQMAKLIDGGARKIIMDLSSLEYVSSAGLRVFLSAAKRMKKENGKLSLASPSPQVKQVLEMAGFSTILPIFSSLAEAAGGLASAEAGTASKPASGNTVKFKLTLAEEVFLLALDNSKGIVKPIPSYALDYALAAALLMELSLCDRVDTDMTALKVTSTEPTGEPLLDSTLFELQQKADPQPTSFWLNRLTTRKKHIEDKVLAQLISKGVLKQEEKRILWVFETHRYPLMDDREVKEVRTRLRELILGDEIPDSREVVLVSLGNACRLLDDLFTAKEKDQVRSRMASLARLDLIGDVLADSIQEIERNIAITSLPNI